ncbi:MAG: hypothetical protein R6X02_27330 [Enhygromyxa sp.]
MAKPNRSKGPLAPALAVGLVSGCVGEPPAPVVEPSSRLETASDDDDTGAAGTATPLADDLPTQCERSLWRMELPRPTAERATLRLEHRASMAEFFRPGLEVDGTCVRYEGEDWQLYATGATVEIAAHPTTLQRWFVGGFYVLIWIKPDEILAYVDNEHSIWDIDGARFTPPKTAPCQPYSACTGANEPREAADCPAERVRCSARPRVVVSSPDTKALRWTRPRTVTGPRIWELDQGEVLWGSSNPRMPLYIEEHRGPNAEVTMLMGIGERWAIWLDGQRLSGRVVVEGSSG